VNQRQKNLNLSPAPSRPCCSLLDPDLDRGDEELLPPRRPASSSPRRCVRHRHGLWSQGSHGLSSASRSPPPSPAASAPPPHRPSSPSHQPRRRATAGSGRLHLRSRQPSVAGSLEHDGRRWMPWLCATDAVLTLPSPSSISVPFPRLARTWRTTTGPGLRM
uniref:Uncharacterized protein n=1 Tax=Aegilops tauschii subsp. strangulata TaxID=200361 RepID=A0A453GBR5_AEGTS